MEEPFTPLTSALERWFEASLADLPSALRRRVDKDLRPHWDSLNARQRRAAAAQWDLENDPANAAGIEAGFGLHAEGEALRAEIERWERVATPSATDLAVRDTKLAALRRALAELEAKERRLLAGGPSAGKGAAKRRAKSPGAAQSAKRRRSDYVAYPKAMQALADQHGATPEELAAWVALGPDDGGLAAYVGANELDSPPRFRFNASTASEGALRDYLLPLMACWFKVRDLAGFQPTRRFITGRALIERWSRRPELRPVAFIGAKIRESRLLDLHPMWGLTQGTMEDDMFPPIEDGLFEVSEIEAIETEDFAPRRRRASSSPSAGQSPTPVPRAQAKPGGATKTGETTAEWGARLLARKRELEARRIMSFNKVIAQEEGVSKTWVKYLIGLAKSRDPYRQLAMATHRDTVPSRKKSQR